MPVDLGALVGRDRSAMLTMELQRGVVGDLTSFPELAEAVHRGDVLANAARLARAMRAAGRPVVHCTAGFRADRAGSPQNAPLIASLLRRPEHLLEGTTAVELAPGLGADPADLVSHRRHGVSPFTGTELDATLRALGTETVLATGVSLNLGIPGLVIEAVNLGYRVVVVTDAVAAVGDQYGRDVLTNTLRLVATLATTDEVITALVA